MIKDGRVKIGDFGLARKLSSQPPYTEYISTRWYNNWIECHEIGIEHLKFYFDPNDTILQ